MPWGGGGLACGIGAAVRALRPSAGSTPPRWRPPRPLAAALAAGEPRTVDYRPSFVDGIGSKTVFPNMFERGRRVLAGALVAPLDEVAAAVRLLAERNHVVAEGAGACPVACAVSGKAGAGRVVCVVSGGNIDLDRLRSLLVGPAAG